MSWARVTPNVCRVKGDVTCRANRGAFASDSAPPSERSRTGHPPNTGVANVSGQSVCAMPADVSSLSCHMPLHSALAIAGAHTCRIKSTGIMLTLSIQIQSAFSHRTDPAADWNVTVHCLFPSNDTSTSFSALAVAIAICSAISSYTALRSCSACRREEVMTATARVNGDGAATHWRAS